MFQVSVGPILHSSLSLSAGVSFPETCGSLPNAYLPCCLNLLPKHGRSFQSQMGFDYFLDDIHYFPSG